MRKNVSRTALFIAALVLAGPSPVEVRQAPNTSSEDSTPFYTGITDPESLTRVVDARISESRQLLNRLLSVSGTRTTENTLRLYDDLSRSVSAASGPAGIISQLHPDARMRETAEALLQRVASLGTDLTLHRGIYDALQALQGRDADPDVKRYLDLELASFRRTGVDRPEETRTRLKTLREELTRTVQEFDRNIREGVRRIQMERAQDLDGLPADFIAAHKPGADGRITLTTEATDVQPVMLYAKNVDVRRRLYMEQQNVAAPANLDVLRRMVTLRSQIAQTLGYKSWADYDTEDRMAATASTASGFIDQIVAAAAAPAERDYRMLLEEKRRDTPGAPSVLAWESGFYTERVRQAQYQFNSQSLRPYFSYERVRDGVFDVTKRLFGFDYVRAVDVPVWHPSVEAYDVFESGRRMGRIYLDMHPRAGKAGSGASTATVRRGVAGRQLPEVVLICRFPGGQPGDPGLMTHAQVTTFFHEFGHLMHAISSGRQAWGGLTRPSERDFIEAPSQMLEEWALDPVTLATFARHHETNEPVPASLIRDLRRANELGRGLGARQQMTFARLSLSLHDREPQGIDPTAIHREIATRYLPIPFADGANMPASFTHLSNGNYAGAYYTYMWSLVIAKDLFTAFDSSNLLSTERSMRYRQLVLARGGAKPAADLVRDLLGRPFNASAWETWLKTDTR